MYEIGLAAPKGGVGKTTLAFNLAWHWYHQGLKVCLVDTDKQHSLLDLGKEFQLPFPVYTAVPKPEGFDVCIIDHPPAVYTNIRGDVIVYPTKAHKFDRDSFTRATPHFGDRKLITVVNMLKLNSKEQMYYANIMKKEHNAIWVKNRTIFETSTNNGVFVGDIKASRVRHQAADEISLVAQKVEICLA